MKKLVLSGGLPALFLMFAIVPASAQDMLTEGTWTGFVYPPDADVIELEYNLAYVDGGLEIEVMLPPEAGVGSLVAEDVQHDGDLLSFTLNVGDVVTCALYAQDDGHYEGECSDSTGEPGTLAMYPPES